MPNVVSAGPDDEPASPRCSDEEQRALTELTAASTLADPQTIVALLGASLLTAGDLIARVAVRPAELPIGILTALLGAPFFLWLLRRREVAL